MNLAGWFIRPKKEVVCIMGVVILALILYSCRLGAASLWLDEGFSLWMAGRDVLSIIRETIQRDYNPPLYSITLHGWIRLFGSSEASLRFLSVCFALVSVVLVWRIGATLLNRGIGLLAALLTAFSSSHIMFAREARSYAMFGMLTLLSMYSLFRLMQSGRRWLWIYLASNVLLLYTHPYAVFVLISQNIYFVITWLLFRQQLQCSVKKWILIQGIAGLLYAPWIFVTMTIVQKIQDGGTCLTRPSLWNIQELIMIFSSTSHKPVGHLFTILAGLSIFWVFRANGVLPHKGAQRSLNPVYANRFVFFCVWLIVPVMASYLVSVFLTPIFGYRYLICCLYPFYLLLAMGCDVIPGRLLRYGICVGIGGFFIYQGLFYVRSERKEEWKQAIAYVESQAKTGDLLLFQAPFCGEIMYPVYSTRKDLIRAGIPSSSRPEDISLDVLGRETCEIAAYYHRVWLFVSHSRDEKGLIPEQFGLLYSHREIRDFLGIRLYCYTNP